MTYVTSEQVSSLAVAGLLANLNLINTVLRVPSNEVAGPSGGKAIIAVPVSREGKIQDRGEDLDSDEINEIEAEFEIEHIYDNAPVSAHQLSLDIRDFGRQVTRRQVEAVARKAERQLADEMNALPVAREVLTDGSDLDSEVAKARADLDKAEVPTTARWLAVSPDFNAVMTAPNSASLVDYQAAAGEEAIRNGVIGRYRGFTVVVNPRLSGFKAAAYHESAFAWANLTPERLPGASDSSVTTEQGVSMRHTFMLNHTKGATQSLLSTFAGAALLDAERVVILGQEAS